jgi:hypothetical protein
VIAKECTIHVMDSTTTQELQISDNNVARVVIVSRVTTAPTSCGYNDLMLVRNNGSLNCT